MAAQARLKSSQKEARAPPQAWMLRLPRFWSNCKPADHGTFFYGTHVRRMEMNGCLQDPVSAPDYLMRQKEAMEESLAAGPRAHTTSKDELTVYLTRWRLHKALALLRKAEP